MITRIWAGRFADAAGGFETRPYMVRTYTNRLHGHIWMWTATEVNGSDGVVREKRRPHEAASYENNRERA